MFFGRASLNRTNNNTLPCFNFEDVLCEIKTNNIDIYFLDVEGEKVTVPEE